MMEQAPVEYRGHLIHLDDVSGCWCTACGFRIEANSWDELKKAIDSLYKERT